MSERDLAGLAAGDTFAGHFRIAEAMGGDELRCEYQVTDTRNQLDRTLYVWLPKNPLPPDERKLLLRRIFAASEIESDRVVHVVEMGEDDATGHIYTVSERVAGETLENYVSHHGPMLAPATAALISAIARALDAAHRSGVVHGDLSPTAVIVRTGDEGQLLTRVRDFGVATAIGALDTRNTAAALYSFTPEHSLRSYVPTPKVDIWSLGLIAYVALVGRSFWDGQTPIEAYREVLMGPLSLPTERARAAGARVPESFDAWFASCTARDASDRFASAGEAATALVSALHDPARDAIERRREQFIKQGLESAGLSQSTPPQPCLCLPFDRDRLRDLDRDRDSYTGPQVCLSVARRDPPEPPRRVRWRLIVLLLAGVVIVGAMMLAARVGR